MGTIYIKHNLCHQIKLGRDVELQNTHIVLFKSLRDVKQVSTLSAQSGLASILGDWYRNATSAPYGHLKFDLSPRTDDRIRFYKKQGIHSLKLLYPGPAEKFKIFGRRTRKISPLSECSCPFPTTPKIFSLHLPKRVYHVPLRMYITSSQMKPANYEKTSRDKTSKRSSIALSKKSLRSKEGTFWHPKKRVTTHGSHYSSRHQPLVLIWSSSFSSLVLCTKRSV